jgi:hypothetical protein
MKMRMNKIKLFAVGALTSFEAILSTTMLLRLSIPAAAAKGGKKKNNFRNRPPVRATVVGCSRTRVANGIADLQALADGEPEDGRIRRPGGGRKKATETEPQLAANFF